MIFLDAERFLEEAIASVLAQTYPSWELLLIDDGSTDGGTAIARHHAERRPEQVRYLEHPGHVNCGMSASRNLGLRHASGRYVAFLDADDVWVPDALAEQVDLLDRHPEAAMVYGPLSWWYGWTGRPEDRQHDNVETLGVPADTLIRPPTLLTLFIQGVASVPSALLVRREVCERVGGFEEAFRGEYEDQVFRAKICLREPVLTSSRSWYRYRQHPDSCVAIGLRSGTAHAARRVFLEWLERYLVEQRVSDPSVWRALKWELIPYRQPRLHRLLSYGQRLADLCKDPDRWLRLLLPASLRRWARSRWQDGGRRPPAC